MNKERERFILEKLLKNKKVTVKELAQELYASEPSIRRDLCSLEKQKMLKRVHGGAVLEGNNRSYMKIPFVIRQLEDSDAYDTIEKYNADIVFFSCRGIAPSGMITDISIEENLVRQRMIKKAVLLCASEKFGKTYMHNLCSINDIYSVISEVEFSEDKLK